MTITNKLETITPKKAAEYLNHNTNNRRLNQRRVNHLTTVIQRGEWQVNGDAIRFDKDDVLVDGQTRLWACVRSGIPIKTYVVRGLPPRVFDTIDQGKSRSLSDVLSKEGIKYYTQAAGATRWLVALRDNILVSHTGHRYSTQNLHDYFLDHPEILESATFVTRTFNSFSCPHAMLSALHCLFAEKDRQEADLFFTRTLAGEHITKADPEYRLRQFFIKEMTATKRTPHETVAKMVIKTWNARRTGKMPQVLKADKDEPRQPIA